MMRIFDMPKLWIFLAVPVLFAQHQAPAASESPRAESGTALFRRHCASCHGKGGEGGRAPSLTGNLHAGDAEADVIRVVSGGIPGTEMMSYEARLGPEKIARIVAYVRSVKRSEAPLEGDPARGEAVFWGKGGCGRCHGVGSRGNRIGPDLSRIGRRRSVGYLRESLLAPDVDIVNNFNGVIVVTADGKTVRGLARSVDDFNVVLQEFSGAVRSFERGELRSVSSNPQSLMPAYGKVLSEAEVDDVLAYLLTLGASQ
jgi:putative heme-binding domain-containing protein